MSKVKTELVAMFAEKAKIAVQLKKEIDASKTDVKRNLLSNKLKKNNLEAHQIIQALSKLPAELQGTDEGSKTSHTPTPKV